MNKSGQGGIADTLTTRCTYSSKHLTLLALFVTFATNKHEVVL